MKMRDVFLDAEAKFVNIFRRSYHKKSVCSRFCMGMNVGPPFHGKNIDWRCLKKKLRYKRP